MCIDLSIIIPIYNGGKHLDKCLQSIFAQEGVALDVILIDDCSTDDTVKIIKKYESDSRITALYNTENIGQGISRNKGMALAQGTYILFIDVDDYLSDDTSVLKKVICFMNDKELDVLDCPYHVYENNKITLKNRDDKEITSSGPDYLNTKSVLPAVVWNKIFKNSLLQDNNIKFKKRKYEDVSFNLEAILKAKRISNFSEPFYNYVIQEGSTMTATPNKQNVLDVLDLIVDLELIFKEYPNIFQVEKTFFYSFIGAARVIDRYPKQLKNINEEKQFLKQKNKDYKTEILKSKSLNLVIKTSLYISPFFANKVLLLLKK